MFAYHNDPRTKEDIISQLEFHKLADQLEQGAYWDNHFKKGCAVGCTIYSNNHIEYEHRFGIPANLAMIEEGIFEGLSVEASKNWPIDFMKAINVGSNLEGVDWIICRYAFSLRKDNYPKLIYDIIDDMLASLSEGVEDKKIEKYARPMLYEVIEQSHRINYRKPSYVKLITLDCYLHAIIHRWCDSIFYKYTTDEVKKVADFTINLLKDIK